MGIKLVAIRKDELGNITQFLTDKDQVVSFAEAKEFAQTGMLDSLTDIDHDGTWKIETSTQQMEGSNLGDLPEF
ncbi:MAG TPA: hypothetical protein VJ824_09540 [Bacillota bacterium]|nr:hypothetical protein [Bacillota bacterium]